MSKLPKISGDMAIRVFKTFGFNEVRQRGSHVVMRKGGIGCVIPKHKELAAGTLKSAIKQAGLTADDFCLAYEKI